MERQILTTLLAAYLLVSFFITLAYLVYRRCTTQEILLWGLVALLLPVLGSFVVIAARPGPRKRSLRSTLARQAAPSPKG